MTVRDVAPGVPAFRHSHDRRLEGLIVAVVDGAPGLPQEAAAPMTIITAAAVNTTTNPLWNGPEIKCGKN
jgi:hypothetical protein